MSNQCVNLLNDRAKGEAAAQEFKVLVEGELGGDTVVLHPHGVYEEDAEVLEKEYHEIRAKYPTKHETYGFEEYRLNKSLQLAKQTGKPVFYTIKDTKRKLWVTINFQDLVEKKQCIVWGKTWCGGKEIEDYIHYWNINLWESLESHLRDTQQP